MQNSGKSSYLVICLNPTIQRTIVLGEFKKGEVNRSSEWRVDAAGKGACCSRVLGQCGHKARYLTQLGGPSREWFLSLCSDDGIEVRWVESYSPIRFCTTLIDQKDGTATEIVEESAPVDQGTAARILSEFEQLLPEASTLIFSGTTAKGFPQGFIPSMVQQASLAGKRIYLDIKGKDLVDSLPACPIVVKPNLEELLQTYPKAPRDESEIREMVAQIGKDYFSRWGSYLVVTRGGNPTLYWDGQALCEYPVLPVTAINPIGSGDSFTVGVATALDEGADIAEAVAEGTRLGALNAVNLKPGSIL